MESLKKYSLLLTIFFAFSIVFTSSLGEIRIPFYKIFQLFFIFFSISAFQKKDLYHKFQNYFMGKNIFILLVIIFLIKVFSGLLIMFYNYGPEVFNQYFKWLIVESVDLLFYFYFITFILSSTFSIFQFIIYYFYQHNILSIITNLPFIWTQENLLETYAWGPVLRVGGFMTGPNLHATTLCLLLPLVLYSKIFRFRFYILFLLVSSLLFTLSRTGFVAFFVILILGLLYKKLSFKSLNYVGLFIGIICLIFYSNYSDIFDTILLRFNMEGLIGSRFDVFRDSFFIFLKHPFGVGINSFSEVYFLQYGIKGFNPHNDWITFLVELGVIGLIGNIIYYLYLLITTKIYLHKLSFPLFCIIISQCIAGFFNQTIVLFQSNLIMIMLYLYITSDNEYESIK